MLTISTDEYSHMSLHVLPFLTGGKGEIEHVSNRAMGHWMTGTILVKHSLIVSTKSRRTEELLPFRVMQPLERVLLYTVYFTVIQFVPFRPGAEPCPFRYARRKRTGVSWVHCPCFICRVQALLTMKPFRRKISPTALLLFYLFGIYEVSNVKLQHSYHGSITPMKPVDKLFLRPLFAQVL